MNPPPGDGESTPQMPRSRSFRLRRSQPWRPEICQSTSRTKTSPSPCRGEGALAFRPRAGPLLRSVSFPSLLSADIRTRSGKLVVTRSPSTSREEDQITPIFHDARNETCRHEVHLERQARWEGTNKPSRRQPSQRPYWPTGSCTRPEQPHEPAEATWTWRSPAPDRRLRKNDRRGPVAIFSARHGEWNR